MTSTRPSTGPEPGPGAPGGPVVVEPVGSPMRWRMTSGASYRAEFASRALAIEAARRVAELGHHELLIRYASPSTPRPAA